MRTGSTLLRDVLTGGSFNISHTADLFYGTERKFQDLPISDLSLEWNANGEIELLGSCTAVWSDAHGSSLSPVEAQDWLAPFGSRLVIYAVVTAAPFLERVRLGEFTITDVPSADDSAFMVGTTRVVVGSRVNLRISDRMVEVADDRFTQLAQPSQLTSVYTELAALTGFQVTRTLPDLAITRAVVYEEDRISVIQDLANILGGVAFMESDGSVSVRSLTAGSPVAALTVGPEGTVRQVGAALSRKDVYNGIVIRGETSAGLGILHVLWVTAGPLRATPEGQPRTPFHRKPKFYSSPYITTPEQAIAAAPGLLAGLAAPRASQLQVQCFINPLLQLGDVVTVWDGLATWTIRLVKVTGGEGAYMTVLGDVISRVVGR